MINLFKVFVKINMLQIMKKQYQ